MNFLECCRARNRETMSTPELGAAAFTTVNMGVQSYRNGQVLFWDKEARRTAPADASWATRWERRSRERGTPNQIIGWQGGNAGSTLTPEDYQRSGRALDRWPRSGSGGRLRMELNEGKRKACSERFLFAGAPEPNDL